jgi:hypothetical protein
MPRIELIPEVLYGPQDPIHWEIDNLPLKAIIRRQNLINLSLDNVLEQMRNAIGTQGSLSNRLNQSINPDGSLKESSIDNANHSIESHEDSELYVRMTRQESEKLATVDENATDLSLEIYTDESSFVEFPQGTLRIQPSDTVSPSFESPNVVKFNLSFPSSVAHEHYYAIEPVPSDQVNPDYINFKTSSAVPALPYVDGSLKVFINGMRIYEDAEVYVPGALIDEAWTLMSFTSDSINGTFALSSALSSDDVIRVDFDRALL